MPAACCLFRSNRAYRRDSFEGGLQRLGYRPESRPKANPEPGDVLVLWNRKAEEERFAQRYERAGATVVVAENGYIGEAPGGGKLYALAMNHHNGAGTWREGGPERWDALGLELVPWRSDGEHVVILPQRGIGEQGVAMPQAWLNEVAADLPQMTHRRVRIRRHPGREKAEPYESLAGAWCAVTWGSGAAIKAIVAGIPVFHGLRAWIGAPAARESLDIEAPWMGDRLPMLRRLAWAQHSLAEIESGEAFAWLLTS